MQTYTLKVESSRAREVGTFSIAVRVDPLFWVSAALSVQGDAESAVGLFEALQR